MGVYLLEKEFRFEASHQLHDHDGKCARLHGHSWLGRVILKGTDKDIHLHGPKTGMLMDYGDVKKILEPIIEEYLDHHHLNETLEMQSPTSEKVAKWLYRKLKPLLPMLLAVQIDETCTSRVYYHESESESTNCRETREGKHWPSPGS
jgi:6-pyruvoyltetrahydropterin/6-carboxytetrahydropterin synthase